MQVMKIVQIIIIMAFSLILICFGQVKKDGRSEVTVNWDKVKEAAKRYETHPTPENALLILRLIPEERPTLEIGSDKGLQYLVDNPVFVEHVLGGEEYIAEVAFRLYTFVLPGDTLEILDISLSGMLVKKPELYLKLLKKYKPQFPSYKDYPLIMMEISEEDINSDEDMIRELLRRIKVYQERIKALETVQDPEYLELRDECIKILENQIRELQEQIKKLDKSFKRNKDKVLNKNC